MGEAVFWVDVLWSAGDPAPRSTLREMSGGYEGPELLLRASPLGGGAIARRGFIYGQTVGRSMSAGEGVLDSGPALLISSSTTTSLLPY